MEGGCAGGAGGAGHFSAGRQEMASAGCAKTGNLTERLYHLPSPPLPPPQQASYNGRATVTAPQHYSAAACTNRHVSCFQLSLHPLTAFPLYGALAGQTAL